MSSTPRNEPGFWDASAVVPLCVHQMSSRKIEAQLRHSALVVWWTTHVEVHSAIARLHREGELTEREKVGAISRLSACSRMARDRPF